MADVSTLEVLLYGEPIGTLTLVPGDRSLFAFHEEYIEDAERPVLSLGFKDTLGELVTEFRPYGPRVMPFFSNLLPEGRMRGYLAERAGVNSEREFFLLWALGSDLPGAITIRSVDGDELPPVAERNVDHDDDRNERVLRFSLAGVQLKFSAIMESKKGLTIPARGIGGSWIVKLPSTEFDAIPENEYSMMTLARLIGMDVPAIDLVDISSIKNLPSEVEKLAGKAYIIERFDRLDDGSPVHIEDFAQVFGVYPHDKYKKASSANIAAVIAAETDEGGIVEFIRRLTFNTLIGNADMHVENWSMRYLDRRNAVLAPAYDFVSTIPYIPDDEAALKFSRTRRFDAFNEDELAHLANRAAMPETLVLDTARETVELFHQYWNSEKENLPLSPEIVVAINSHVKKVPLASVE
jgi:serine/threonine-protein kinase HipA